jgi:peptide/nickel transport system substrate-binding protein
MNRRLTATPKLAAAIVAVVLVASLLAACGSTPSTTSSPSSGTSKPTGALTIVPGPRGPFVKNFTPFSESSDAYGLTALGMVYEPLMMFNIMNPEQVYPWLATSWVWSAGGRTLTISTRTGVKWSDGQPFTAADVAYTFNLMKRYPALNAYGVTFKGATAPSQNEAVLTFSTPSYQQLYLISQVLIVPQHIWSTIKDPTTFTNSVNPVGTGPYLLQSFTSQDITLVYNPHYWQAGEPKIATLRYPLYVSNTSADLAIEQGQVDWASLYVPDVQKLFVAKDPATNHVWLPPIGELFLLVNLTKSPFDQVAVRQALSEAIDRSTESSSVSGFYIPVSTPTMLLPQWSTYMAPQYSGLSTTYNPAGAKALLLKAGFRQGSNGMLLQPNGTPFKISLLLPAPYTDWLTMGQLMVNEMKKAGIDASLNAVSLSDWTSASSTGTYDMTFYPEWQAPGPFELFDPMFNSSFTAPVGKPAVSNYERWINKATDASLASYSSTQDKATQVTAIQGIESTNVKQVPTIPYMYLTSYAEYSTKNAVGWPSASNPYQMPPPLMPWSEQVVLHLSPVK